MIVPRRAARAASVLVAAVLGAAATGLGAAPAAADSTGLITGVTVTADRQLQANFSASAGSADDVRFSTDNVTMSLTANGEAVPLTATGATSTVPPTVMLVLDTSGSMTENNSPKFAREQTAARMFLTELDKNDFGKKIKIGLTTFGSPAKRLISPTLDHAQVDDTIKNLEAKGDTDLYNAVIKSAAEFTDLKSQPFMIMATDGTDDPQDAAVQRVKTPQRRELAQAALRDKGVIFKGLIIGDATGKNALQQVTKGYEAGQVITEKPGATEGELLGPLFADSKAALDSVIQVSAPIPDRSFTGTVTLTITARTAGGAVYTGEVPTTQLSQARPATPTTTDPSFINQGSAISTPVVIAALGALFLAMVVLIVSATGAVTAGESKESEVTRRLSFYTLSGSRDKPVIALKDEPNTRFSDSRVARSAINLVNRIARQRKLDQALDTRLESAGLPIRTAEWTLLHLGIAVGSALLILVATRGKLLGAVLGLAIGLGAPWMFLNLRTSMRERKFLSQLPDTLQLLSGSLAAGYSLPQAMDAVLRESEAPIRVEFNRALIETRLGMPPEDALEGIAARTASKDFSWVVMAIRIQREVGGNLAELLATVAETLRERERLRRQVSALSAEGRLSGMILGALPLLFALFLIFTKPDYIAPLFDQRIGLLLLGTGTVLLLLGGFWMSRLVKVEV